MDAEEVPPFVSRLLWEFDLGALDLDRHRWLLFERVMSRGSWEAMVWLREHYPVEVLAKFLRSQGSQRLSPRDLAYWSLICEVDLPAAPGGGRPKWTGP